jgi:hypothetical protein
MRYWRNLILATIAVAFCFGGACECKAKATRANRNLASFQQ